VGKLDPESSEALSDSALKDKDILEGLEKSLAESYPSLLEPLIVERDIFLSLTAKSSMAVNGCKRVVAVVGKGHAKGVMRCLSENHNGKFKTLTWTPTRAALKDKVFGVVPRVIVNRLVVDTIVFVLLFYTLKLVFPSINMF